MTPLIEKYINKEKIELIAKEKHFDVETLQEFVRFLDLDGKSMQIDPLSEN